MAYEVHEGVVTIEGDKDQHIGRGTDELSMVFYVQEGSASTTEAVGIENGTSQCRFEVRGDGKGW